MARPYHRSPEENTVRATGMVYVLFSIFCDEKTWI